MRVVGLGAICDLDPDGIDTRRENRFSVSEFVLLDNGERVTLHAERGYAGKASSGDIWAHETVETITRNVLNTVLPDDDDTDDEHPCRAVVDVTTCVVGVGRVGRGPQGPHDPTWLAGR